MNKFVKTLIILIVIIIAIAAVVMWQQTEDTSTGLGNDTTPNVSTTTNNGGDRMMSVEDYIRINISSIANQFGTPEVLGGTFYVTEISTNEGKGVVEFEDGHNAFTADFTYSVDERTGITLNSFVVRK